VKSKVTLVSLFLALTCIVPIFAGSPTRVIIILREFSRNMEFMIANEVVPMAEALRKAGYKVDLASESGRSIVAGNAKLIPDLKLADAQNADYAGVLIPCMEAGDFPPAESTPEAGVALIKASR
jgi:hypothetical protein